MKNPEQKEHHLLESLAAGDQNAFREIFHAYSPRIYGFALKLTRSQTLAEEIVQDIFMKIWVGRESLSAIDNLQAYLYTLSKNHAFNILKRISLEEIAKAKISKDLKEVHHETEETIDFHESEEILNQVINRLPPQQKLVYSLCHQEGLKYEEVALRLNISRLTVKTHMQQALRTIKLHFSGFIGLLLPLFLVFA
jgi:RNA polymerase sigma-70 factor (ECF subfamily)